MVKINKYSKMISYSFFLFLLVIPSCKERYEELELVRTDYDGKKLKLDGYYYYQEPNFTTLFFLYKNGVIYDPGSKKDTDLNKIDSFIIKIPPLSREARIRWGIFQVNVSEINIETWDIVSGGKIPTNIRKYNILNDTTIVSNNDAKLIYKFRKFSPKPDSINNFIK